MGGKTTPTSHGTAPEAALGGFAESSTKMEEVCAVCRGASRFAGDRATAGRGTSLGCFARLLHHQIDRHNGSGGGGEIGRQG